MKYIALLLIVANVGFFFFHDDIVQKPAQLEPAPLPKDVPRLKLVKEINKEQPKPVVEVAEVKTPEKTEKPISDNPSPELKNKEIQAVAIAQPDTVSQEDPVKIAAQAFDVLKVLKKEADRVTTSIDQAVSTTVLNTNPPDMQPKVEPPKTAEKVEKTPETPKMVEKTIVLEKPVEEPKMVEKTIVVEKTPAKIEEPTIEKKAPVANIPKKEEKPKTTLKEEKTELAKVEKVEKIETPTKPVEVKKEDKKEPIIEKVEPVTLVEKTAEKTEEGDILEEVKTEAETEDKANKLPIELAASKKNKKNCYYSGIYERKFEASKAKSWLEKQKVNSTIKDWKNRVRSGKTIFLPAANHDIAKKLLKRLSTKKIKDYALIKNGKDGYLINLGSFRTEKSLQNRLSELKKKGFYGLKVQDRYLDIPVFRLKMEIVPSQRSVLDNFSKTFKVPRPQVIDCEAQ